MQETLSNILSFHNIRPTAVRILILRTLFESERPMTSHDIEQKLSTVDRSSITRAISLFVDKGLIHPIDDGSGASKYELCPADSHSHRDMHPHFRCRNCDQTFCISDQQIPSIELPENFQAEKINYVITGTCPDCSQK